MLVLWLQSFSSDVSGLSFRILNDFVHDFLTKVVDGPLLSLPVCFMIRLYRGPFPKHLTLGFGAGMSYADCDRSFNPARIPGTRIISTTEK